MWRPFLSDRTASPTLIAAAAFGAGALVAPCAQPLAPVHFLAALVAALGGCVTRQPPLRCALGILLLALAGHALQDIHHLRQRVAREQLRGVLSASDRCDFRGQVEGAWWLPGNRVQARVLLRTLDCSGEERRVEVVTRLTWPVPRNESVLQPPRAGDWLRGHARFAEPSPARNPGALDAARLLGSKGVLLLGRIKSHRLVSIEPEPEPAVRARLARLRARALARLRNSVDRVEEPHSATAELLSALLLGERHGLDPQLRSDLQNTGLYHLVAISGLHVALLAWLLIRLASALGFTPGVRALGVVLILGVYVLLIGVPASAGRAYGMFVLWTAGRHTGRRPTGLSLLMVVSALMLLVQPGWRDDIGYWLSVWATGGIIGSLRGLLSPAECSGARVSVASLLRTSASAYVAVAPLSALWFQRWTPLGILLNVVAVPLASFLLCCALALVVLEGTSLAAPLAAAADTGVRALAGIASQPIFSHELFRLPPPTSPVLCTHLGACAVLWFTKSSQRRWTGLLTTAHLALILPAAPMTTGSLTLTLWDVGQGESALVSLPDGSHIVVDTGGRLLSGGTAAERWVVPALRTQRIRRVRAVVLSHLDSDHAAGLEAVLGALEPAEVWAPEGLNARARDELRAATSHLGARLLLRGRGERWGLGGATAEVLSPESRRTRRSDNAGSLVLRVSAEGEEILLTGDLEASGERSIAARGPEPVSVLKVSHHGSRSSSDTIFLRRVRPRAALISAGSRNAWGHPHEETLDRLRKIGAFTLSTSNGGAVRARMARGVVRMERWGGAWETSARLEPARLALP